MVVHIALMEPLLKKLLKLDLLMEKVAVQNTETLATAPRHFNFHDVL